MIYFCIFVPPRTRAKRPNPPWALNLLHLIYMKHIAFIILAALLCACGQESVVTVTLPDGFEVSARVADTPQTHEKRLDVRQTLAGKRRYALCV